MSKEDELFDAFLRSKLGSKEFTNKPHYWQNAQEMIAHGRKSNSSFTTIIVGSIILVAAIGLGLLFTNNTTQNNLTASAVPVGTSTTSTYVIAAAATPVSQTGQLLPASSNSGQTNTPEQEQSTVSQNNHQDTDKGNRNPNDPGKKRKNNKHNRNAAASSDPTVQYNSTVEAIDINGKTFMKPIGGVSTTGNDYNKTTAYITYAAKAQKSFIAVEAGLNLYNHGNSDVLSSVKGQVGIRYYRFVAPKFALSTGLTYAMQHQNLPTRSFESTDYDFGKNSSSTTITTQRLDYIELPVSALYQLTPSHSLTAGVTVGYVIQSHDKLNDVSGKTSYQTGYLNAINRWDTQLDLGYQYNFSHRMWIRTSCHMGLMDISDNSLFKQNETHTNKGLRITLGYKVF